MAIFLIWLGFWVAGGIFGPVQYHPTPSELSAPVIHEAADVGR